MKALDVGCGEEPELWFSGADLCDPILDPSLYTSAELEGRIIFPQEINIQTPQIFSDPGVYDFIWCGSAWDWMSDETRRIVEAEFFRLLRKGGRVILRELTLTEDLTAEGETFDIQKFLKEQLAFFPEERWFGFPYYNIDTHPCTLDDQAYLYLLHLEKR